MDIYVCIMYSLSEPKIVETRYSLDPELAEKEKGVNNIIFFSDNHE